MSVAARLLVESSLYLVVRIPPVHAARHSRVAVRRLEACSLRDARRRVCQDVAAAGEVTIRVRIEVSDHGKSNVGEHAVLDEDLRAHAAVDARGGEIGEHAVVDVTGAEAERWGTRVHVAPEVVVICNAQVTGILGRVRVTVTNERALSGRMSPGFSLPWYDNEPSSGR